jgi:[acyl-carrier-protein] S-malonyltransferase
MKKEVFMALAFIAPGQGAQFVGMGLELTKSYPQSRSVYEEVDDALGEKLSDLIWYGSIEDLTLTENAQPALMATTLAVFRALQSEGLKLSDAKFVAGHSLGEYSALAMAGSLSISDAAKLLRVRGRAMQNAVPVGVGAMAAILGLTYSDLVAITKQAAGDGVCQAANDNDPSQVVVSGHKDAVERAMEIAKEAGAKRVVLLPVSAPFHSELMAPASLEMKDALSSISLVKPSIPLVSNVKAQAVSLPAEIRSLLVEQVTGVVRWRESIEWMVSNGVTEMMEIGAGRALSGMVRRINRSISCVSVSNPVEVAKVIFSQSEMR